MYIILCSYQSSLLMSFPYNFHLKIPINLIHINFSHMVFSYCSCSHSSASLCMSSRILGAGNKRDLEHILSSRDSWFSDGDLHENKYLMLMKFLKIMKLSGGKYKIRDDTKIDLVQPGGMMGESCLTLLRVSCSPQLTCHTHQAVPIILT